MTTPRIIKRNIQKVKAKTDIQLQNKDENKMQWLIDNINDNKVEYIIANTHRSHGAISCPTGWGKSGLIFVDMIYRIKEAIKNDEKLILHLSTPQLKLCGQQGIDFLQTLNGVYQNLGIDKTRIVFINNNSGGPNIFSANDKNLVNEYGYDCISFKDMEDYFINSDNYDIAILISCHKSVPKFINYFVKQGRILNTNIVSYLDEAHTISVTDEASEDTTKIDIYGLGNISNNLYLISATNKQNIVKIVNSFNTNSDDDSYIFQVKPSDAIDDNIICSPIVGYHLTDDGKITAQICIAFMKQAQNVNKKIYHKILITCKDTKHLEKLREELKKMGCHVFSTCSKDGMNNIIQYENTNTKYDNIKDFITAIDNYKGDCFILHIRQMISGIDVKGLTDAIISKADTDNFNSYDTIIQIIGRTLRLGDARGKSIDDPKRKKKHANILFVSTSDNDTIQSNLSKFLISYYGIDNIKFSKNFSTTKFSVSDKQSVELFNPSFLIKGSETYSYNEMYVNIEKFIKENILEHKNFHDSLGLPFDETLKNDLKELESKFSCCNGEIYLTKYIDDKALRTAVNDLLKKYNII